MKPTVLTRLVFLLAFTTASLSAGAATWYVNRDAKGGDGSRSAPFASLRAAQEASAPGDTIVVSKAAAPYDEGIALKEGQTLAAAAQGSPTLRLKSGAAVSVRDAGNITIRDITIELAESGEGIVLANARGNLIVQRGGVTGAGSGTAVSVEGGDASIVFDAFPITQSAGSAVVIRNHHNGAVVFRNGSAITVSGGTKDAIVLASNSGSYAFNDPLKLVTAGARALAIDDSGSVAISDAKSELTTTGAAGIRIAATKVAIALGKVSVDGKGTRVEEGMALERVSGTFSVTGGSIRNVVRRGIALVKSSGITLRGVDFTNVPSENGVSAQLCGSRASGGAHLKCGAAIHLNDVENVALRDVVIGASEQNAINGDGVRNLELTNVEVRGAGDELDEHGVQLRNVSGDLKLADCRIRGSASRQLNIINDAGEAAIDIRNSTFGQSAPPNGGQGILINAGGDARLRVVVDGATFIDNFSNAIQIVAAANADVRAEIVRGTFRKNAAAVSASVAGASKLALRVEGNTISGSTSTALNVHSTSAGEVQGEMVQNVIGISGKSASGAACGGGCSGISITSLGRGATRAVIARNTVQQVDASGIQVRGGGIGSLAVRVTGNLIREPAGAESMHAISVMAGMKRTDSVAVCAELGGPGVLANTISGAWNASGGGAVLALVRMFDNTSLAIAGYSGDPASAKAVGAFVAQRNRGAGVEATLGSGVKITGRCSIP